MFLVRLKSPVQDKPLPFSAQSFNGASYLNTASIPMIARASSSSLPWKTAHPIGILVSVGPLYRMGTKFTMHLMKNVPTPCVPNTYVFWCDFVAFIYLSGYVPN